MRLIGSALSRSSRFRVPVLRKSTAWRLAFFAFALTATLAIPSQAAAAYTFGTDVTPTDPGNPDGTVAMAYANRCPIPGTMPPIPDDYDMPDAPVRVFRDAGGRFQLYDIHASFRRPQEDAFADGGGARRLTGMNMNNLTKDCRQVLLSSRNPSVSSFDNYEWLTAPYSTDGQNVYGIVHNEWHGWDFGPPLCPSVDPPNRHTFVPECWYNALTFAKSTDKGDTYTHGPYTAPNHAIATLPYQYRPDNREYNAGYFESSNIVRGPDGYYYVMFYAQSYRGGFNPDHPEYGNTAQQTGTCVMRTDNLNSPTSWRAWGDANGDGNKGYEVQFVSAYPEPPDPENHVCTPVTEDTNANPPGQETEYMRGGLIYSRYFHRYILIGFGYNPSAPVGNQFDVYYTLSKKPDDLTQWEPRRKLMDAEITLEECNPGDPKPTAYFTIVDRNSTSRNFETAGRDFDLYFTRWNTSSCNGTKWDLPLSRDLVRVPLRFTRPINGERNATLESELAGGPTGFDFTWSDNGSISRATGSGAYEGNAYANFLSYGTSPGPLGVLNANAPGVTSTSGWGNHTDVWYGAAFKLSSGFALRNDRVMLMRWQNAAYPSLGSRYGGIVLGGDDKYRLVRGNGTSEDVLDVPFTLPEGNWVWLEVHQKLESTVGNKPVSDVFVNGTLVASSTAANAYADSEGKPIRLHFGYAQRNTSALGFTTMQIDRASISLNERGPIGAPATPTGVTGTEGSSANGTGYITLMWNAQTDNTGGGFRVYEQRGDGSWVKIYETVSSAYLNTGLPSCVPRHYRVSAFNSAGLESPASEEIELIPRATSAGC